MARDQIDNVVGVETLSDSMPEPRVSVVIPTFNRAVLVARAIESVLSQSRPANEIIVVDDGSTDDTVRRLADYAKRGVRVIRQENAGAPAARNHGVALAAYRWIAFLDSDDVWVPEHLERIAAAIRGTQGAASFYFGDTCFQTEEGDASSYWRDAGYSPSLPFEIVSDATKWVSMALQPMMFQSSVVSRERLLGQGGFWTALPSRHDSHLFFLLGLGCPACAVPGAGAQMTNDATGGRLTDVHTSQTTSYWLETVLMYGDVASRFPNLDKRTRTMLKRRLANAHWRLGRLQWVERRYRVFVQEILRSCRAAPAEVPRLAGRRLRGLIARCLSP